MYYLHSMESIFCVVIGEGGLFLIIPLYRFLSFWCFSALQKAPLVTKKTTVNLLLTLFPWRSPSQLLCRKFKIEILNSHTSTFLTDALVKSHNLSSTKNQNQLDRKLIYSELLLRKSNKVLQVWHRQKPPCLSVPLQVKFASRPQKVCLMVSIYFLYRKKWILWIFLAEVLSFPNHHSI